MVIMGGFVYVFLPCLGKKKKLVLHVNKQTGTFSKDSHVTNVKRMLEEHPINQNITKNKRLTYILFKKMKKSKL